MEKEEMQNFPTIVVGIGYSSLASDGGSHN